MYATFTPYPVHATAANSCANPSSNPNMLSYPINTTTIGKNNAKYNSSKNDVIMTIPVDRPAVMPSRLMKNNATLVPPTADGVTADENSHNMMILNAAVQLKSPSLNNLILIMYPMSRPNMNNTAPIRNTIVMGVNTNASNAPG